MKRYTRWEKLTGRRATLENDRRMFSEIKVERSRVQSGGAGRDQGRSIGGAHLKSASYKSPGRGGARAGAGKPPFQPTETDRSMVSVLAAVGMIHENIASIIGPGLR